MEPVMKKEEQLLFEWEVWERPCRTCSHLGQSEDTERGSMFICLVGQFKLTNKLAGLPKHCGCFKWGGEKMAYVDFRKMSEEQLRGELRKIQEDRAGIGRKVRRAAVEGRIKHARAKKAKEIIKL